MPRPRHYAMEEFDRALDELPIIERCSFCEWVWEGTAGEGREVARAHRLSLHPEIKPMSRRGVRNLRSFRQPSLRKKDWQEIYAERDKRAKLHGVDISPAEA